ncbi:TrmB family transcriptional regulator [Candidatus Pacearchaeota archaeon]|nr:TrmB family transcriptional regulator [Candidatus Pacearchaeota archaeon]
MESEEILKEMGFSESESKVYLALLRYGSSLAGTISRKTGIHRRNVYDITDRMIKKGVVGYILKNNRRFFEAVNPERILDILKKREREFVENLPMLKEIYEGSKDREETNFYKGIDGLKIVFEDQLEDNKEILVLGASKSAFEVLPFYFKWYDKDRIKKKIRVRIISSDDLGKRIPLAEIRFLPEKYSNPLAINIYKDKVAIIFWKKVPTAVVIKEKEVADSYRKYFEFMWRSAKS